MVFTSVLGHLLELEFADGFDSWNACRPEELFTVRVEKKVKTGDMQALERQLKKEARACQRLILWLDCDSEGENIAFEIMNVCRQANPR